MVGASRAERPSRLPEPGPRAEIEARPWSRNEKLALAGLTLGVLASLGLLVHPWYDPVNDGSMYISLARSLLAGEGYTYLGVAHIIRPPGFPVLIAPLIATSDPAELNFHALNLFVALFAAVGVVLVFVFQRPRLGPVLALCVAVAIWLNPGYQRLANLVMSDMPGTTLLLACLLVERWAARAPSTRRELALGLAIGLAAYVRSLVVLLVPAIVLSRLLLHWSERRDGGPWLPFLWRRVAVFAAVAWLVMLPWNLRDGLRAPPPPADQTRLYDYSTAMWHVDPGDPASPTFSAGEILARIPLRVHQMAEVLGSRLLARNRGNQAPETPLLSARTGIAALLVVCTGIVALRRRAPAELFAAGSLAVMGLYFGFSDRLLLPVYVIALPASVEVARNLVARFASPRAASVAVATALAGLVAVDLHPRRGWDEIERTHRGYLEIAAGLVDELPSDTRLGAGLGFHYAVYTGRPVWSVHPAVRRAQSPEGAEQMIDKYDLDTIVLSPLVGREPSLMPYFEGRYGEPLRVGPGLVWRVRP